MSTEPVDSDTDAHDHSGDPDFMTSLARGLAVIQAFRERRQHLSISQISQRTRISRSAVRRCLHTLCMLGFVAREERSYRLLPKILTLGHAYLSSTPLALAAEPVLDRLSEKLHEACNLGTLEGNEVLYVARSAVGKRVVSVDLHVGSRLPAYCTSMGRVLLAALDEPALQAYLQGTQRVLRTRYTQYREDVLSGILQQVRQQGWCLVDQELEMGLRSIAVPVRDHAGNVKAAMQVSSHADRIGCQEMISVFLPELLQASKSMMNQL